MAVDPSPGRLPNWTGPESCPFCGAALADGGPAFMDHVRVSPACETAFDVWRRRAADDIAGGWSG